MINSVQDCHQCVKLEAQRADLLQKIDYLSREPVHRAPYFSGTHFEIICHGIKGGGSVEHDVYADDAMHADLRALLSRHFQGELAEVERQLLAFGIKIESCCDHVASEEDAA
jgi:hypothetical protein